MKQVIALAAAACTMFAFSAEAETVTGRATITDGDSLVIAGQHIRIFNIDAPEGGQLCFRKGVSLEQGAWPCGQEAASALAAWIDGRRVTCKTIRLGLHNSWLARCTVGSDDLGQWLAASGWAVPFDDCECEGVRSAADGARSAEKGIWSSAFTMPWDWRKDRELASR